MYVYIYRTWVDCEIQEIVRLRFVGYQLFVARNHGFVEIRVTHMASVNEEILQKISFASALGTANKAINFHQRGVHTQWYQLCVEVLTEQRRNACLERAGQQLIEHIIVVYHSKLYIMVYECQFFKFSYYVIQLHRIGLEKLASGRNIIENVLNHKVAAFGANFGFLLYAFRTVYLYHRT